MIRTADEARRAEAGRAGFPGTSPAAYAPPVNIGGIASGASVRTSSSHRPARPHRAFAFAGHRPAYPHPGGGRAHRRVRNLGVSERASPRQRNVGTGQAAVEANDLAALESAAVLNHPGATQPLAIAGIPPRFTQWVDSFNVGIAGFIAWGRSVFAGMRWHCWCWLGPAWPRAGTIWASARWSRSAIITSHFCWARCSR